jgi:AcrR family transcriptional regulator
MKSSVLPDAASSDDSEMRKRILGAAFQAFTANGYAGTTTLAIAARAKVSKRDLYAIFENKQAMLVACIGTRTAKMRMPEGLPEPRSREMLASTLTAFAANLLTESSHPAVIAMFRLAISEAERSPEVAQALEEGRKASRRTLTEFLVHAQSVGLLPSGDAADMADQCLALIRDDLMLSLLLGVLKRPSLAHIQRNAAKAVAVFLGHHPKPAQNRRTA